MKFLRSHHAWLSLLFGAGLELVYTWPSLFWISIPLLLLAIVAGMVLLRWEEAHRFQPTQMILPMAAAIGLAGLSLFLPTVGWTLHAYVLAASWVLYFLLRHGARQAYPTWNWIISLVVLFINLATLLSWHWYAFLPMLALMAGVWLIISLIAFQSLIRLRPPAGEAALLAACLGLVLAQIAWVLQFLPAHPITETGLLVALYYVSFHLLALSLQRILKLADALEYGLIGLAALALLLTSQQWT